MKKKYLVSILIFILFSSCTYINLREDILSGIKTLNYFNFNKKNVINIGKLISYYDLEYKTNTQFKYEKVIYKNAKLEIFSPVNKKNDKVIYWIHGGAFLYPLSNVYRYIANYMLSINSEYDIALLDYSLLPEARYPIANIETENGIEFLEKKYRSINMIGDSAGGNLVVSSLIKRKDEKKKLVNSVVLYSPFLDISFSVDSRINNRNKDILIGNPYDKDYVFEKLLTENDYYKEFKDKKNPYISPIFYDDFKDFPPTYIEVGKEEVLYDDSLILANKLPNVEMVSISGLFHDFQIVLALPTARDSIKRTYEFLDKYNK